MSPYTIPDPNLLKKEILASHERCHQYGINPQATLNLKQEHLTPKELSLRRNKNKDFLGVATAQIEELYRFVAGAGFVVSLADNEGYLLDIIGDTPVLEKLAKQNLTPGYRWTERDVGTSAISLVIASEIPVQVNDEEHFCKRGYGHTCSASPVCNPDSKVIGVIAMSGDANQVHPHTLGMVITAARAIENQLRIMRTSKELLLRNNYMNALIESIDSGVLAVDRNGSITQVNDQAKQIFQIVDDLKGKPLSALLGLNINIENMMHPSFGYIDRESFIKTPFRDLQLITTAKPIFDSEGQVQGIIFIFNEINRIRKLINKMAGSQARFTFEDIIGVSSGIQEARKMAMLAAVGNSTVLLLGETGTGKELFAQAIHNQSTRRDHPFVAINCGAIPRELLESELFGYVEGAFTGARKGGRPGKFELSDGGTIFLDEIGDMPLDMQVKLLRALQSGEVYRLGQHKPISVDIRIIAATHLQLKEEVDKGNFREDLFYRINVLPISIPPLRVRKEDIILLTRSILNRCCQGFKKSKLRFSSEAEKVLENYQWPGNVRELENVIERAINLAQGEVIEPEHFGSLTTAKKKDFLTRYQGSALEELERQTIIEITEMAGCNISKAAKMLGISRATLYNLSLIHI